MTGKKEQAISIWDELDDRSLVKIVDVRFLAHMERCQRERPEWLNIEESELYHLLRQYTRPPTKLWNRMRLQFWNDYETCQHLQTMMNMEKVYVGVCTKEAFRNLCKRNEFIAWMLCPPANWNTLLKEAVNFWLEEMREILAEPNKDKTGKLDHKLVTLKIKIGALLDMRLHGAFTQRVEQLQRNVNINLTAANPEVAGQVMDMTVEGLEKRIKELEAVDKKYGSKRLGIKESTVVIDAKTSEDE